MLPEETHVIFRKLDRHDERIRELESTGKVTDHRLTQAEINYHEMCSQLVKTETKVMSSMGELNKKQDQLIADYNQREGASRAAKWFWAGLGIILTCLQIYQILKP